MEKVYLFILLLTLSFSRDFRVLNKTAHRKLSESNSSYNLSALKRVRDNVSSVLKIYFLFLNVHLFFSQFLKLNSPIRFLFLFFLKKQMFRCLKKLSCSHQILISLSKLHVLACAWLWLKAHELLIKTVISETVILFTTSKDCEPLWIIVNYQMQNNPFNNQNLSDMYVYFINLYDMECL